LRISTTEKKRTNWTKLEGKTWNKIFDNNKIMRRFTNCGTSVCQ
jgi:hypothetical protein